MMTLPRNPAERRACVDALAREHAFTVRVSTSIPAGVYAYAQWHRRTVVLPADWSASEEGFAAALHETGHLLAGGCPKTEPHRPDPTVRRWLHCVECERVAWEQAMRIAPFTRAMFERLKGSLRTYRRMTPASRGAVAAATRLASDARYAERLQERLTRERQIAEMAAIASAPRYVTREARERQTRLRQHAEIQQLVRGM